MIDPYSNECDENLLDRYLDDDLDAGEAARMEGHLAACRQCRSQVASLRAFSQGFRDRIQHAADRVDFVALEKQVVNKALRQYRPQGGFSRFVASLKFTIPATVATALLLFFAYTHYVLKPPPVPSAIINSFTGSMSSVMIFETPETRQTILWYTEEINVESETDAVSI